MKRFLVFLAIILSCCSIYAIKYQYEKSFAVKTAKEYLANKYEEEMCFRNVAKYSPLVESGGFNVIFYPSSCPEYTFCVQVNSWGEDRETFLLEASESADGETIWSCDSYLLDKFKYEINNMLKEINSTELSLFAIYDNDGYGVPKELSENTGFEEAEKLIDYSIYARAENLSVEDAAKNLCELAELLKQYDLSPNEIVLKYKNVNNHEYIDFEKWSELRYDYAVECIKVTIEQ